MTHKPVKWHSGKGVKEVWEVHIASRDAKRAEDIISGLALILNGSDFAGIGGHNMQSYVDVITRFTGEQIAQALVDHHASALLAIERGLGKVEAK